MPRGSFSSIALRRCRLTLAGSHHRLSTRSFPAWGVTPRFFFGRREGRVDFGSTRAPRTTAPGPSRHVKLEPTSSANRRPANALPLDGTQHRQHAYQAPGTRLSAAIRNRRSECSSSIPTLPTKPSVKLSKETSNPVSSQQDVSHKQRRSSYQGCGQGLDADRDPPSEILEQHR